MTLSDLTEFFKHVARREDSYGILDAFRFHHIMRSQKSNEMIPASYKHDGGDPVPEKKSTTEEETAKGSKGYRKSGHVEFRNPQGIAYCTGHIYRVRPATNTKYLGRSTNRSSPCSSDISLRRSYIC